MKPVLLIAFLILAADLAAAPAPTMPPHPLTHPSAYTSPLEPFRKLLAMNAQQRATELAKRSERSAKILQRKLAEYDAMDPGLRELRLQATELGFYLHPMLTRSAKERALALEHMPKKFAPLVRVRLEKWDQLPQEMKDGILQNQWMMHAVLRYGPKFATSAFVQRLPSSASREAEKHLSAWNRLSPAKRQQLMTSFNSFFSLNPQEQERVIARLPEYDRVKVFATLEEIQQLPATSRRECMNALQRFVAMNAKERMAFFQNAAQWKKLSDVEKKSWRTVVREFAKPPASEAPPLPPGLGEPIAPIQILTAR